MLNELTIVSIHHRELLCKGRDGVLPDGRPCEGEPMQFDPTAIAKRLRAMHRAGHLTHAEYVVGDTLLWSCRAPGRNEAQVSYKRLAKLASVATSKAQEAVRRLRDLGVLTWRKTRLRVIWSLGKASRQGRNIYTLITASPLPRTDTSERPTDRKQASQKGSIAIEEALDRLGSALSAVAVGP